MMVWVNQTGGGGGGMRGSFTLTSRRFVQRFRHQLSISISTVRMIKLFLCSLLLFTTLLVLSCRAASFMGWDHHLTQASLQPSSSSSSSPPRKGYTILINTWKRNDLLRKSISHYISCPELDSVHIVWSEPDPPSKSLLKFLRHIIQSNSKGGRDVDIKFDFNKEDSLNNRFKEIKELKSDAIFSIDDDVIFPCSSVDFAFRVWQSASDTMVGFVPRVHWIDQSEGSLGRYIYGGWWSVWWTGTYSMVLSKAAFFHKKYLDLYTNQMPTSIRDYITKNRNCEDIAMAFLVANATGAPPIWVKGKIFEIGSTGISSLGGHTEKRSECVNRFAAEFGHMPLVSTSVKAVDSRNVWMW